MTACTCTIAVMITSLPCLMAGCFHRFEEHFSSPPVQEHDAELTEITASYKVHTYQEVNKAIETLHVADCATPLCTPGYSKKSRTGVTPSFTVPY